MQTAMSKPLYRRRWWMPAFCVFLGWAMIDIHASAIAVVVLQARS